MSSRDLHPLLRKVNDGLVKVRTEIQELTGQVKKLHETVKEGVDTIVDAINDNTQAQAEIKLIDEMAEVHSLEPQIAAEETTIEEEKQELEATLDQIGERYRDKQEKLDQKAQQRVRNVGEHIFEIDEEEFEGSVETPFVEHVTSTWSDLREHNDTVQASREQSLRGAIDRAYDAMDRFIDRRESLLRDIEDHRVDTELSVDEPAAVHIPFWEITISRGASTETYVVGPSELETNGDEWCQASIDPIKGFRGPKDSISNREPLDTSPSEINRVNNDDLVTVMDQYSSSQLAGQVSYADAFGDALSSRFKTEVEQ